MEANLRVFVTGGAGFIGSHVVRTLITSGHHVLCLVLPDTNLSRLNDVVDHIEVLEGDLRNVADFTNPLRRWKPQSCVHLAWNAEPSRYLHSRENLLSLQGSLDLLHALLACGCSHFIGAGTCAEYEMKSDKLTESDRLRPETLYAASKLSFQLLAQQIATHSKIRFAWARIFYLYGSHEDPRRLVASAILRLHNNEVFASTPGRQVRDYLHVIDVADAISVMVNQCATGIYNICSAEPITIRSLLEKIGSLMGKPELLGHGKLPYRDWEPEFVCGDNQRLRELGWSPQFDLETGLQNTIDWWTAREENEE